jgi:hypothetical protein
MQTSKKYDFACTHEWHWNLSNVNVNIIESTVNVWNVASKKGNGSNALMRFSISIGCTC